MNPDWGVLCTNINFSGCQRIVGSSNDVRLVLPSSSFQHFWSSRTSVFGWNLVFLKHVEGKRQHNLLQEEAGICEEFTASTILMLSHISKGGGIDAESILLPRNGKNPKFYVFVINWWDAGKFASFAFQCCCSTWLVLPTPPVNAQLIKLKVKLRSWICLVPQPKGQCSVYFHSPDHLTRYLL